MASYVHFDPAGSEGLVAEGTTLAAAAERLGVDIRLACGGRGECDSCAVTVTSGLDRLSWPTEGEFAHLADAERAAGRRLACQAHVGEGDCRVTVPPMAEREARAAESAERESVRGGARANLRDAFDALTPGERAAAAVEMQLRVAGDLIGAIVETPMKIGEQLFGAIFNSGRPPVAPQGPPPDETKPGTTNEGAQGGTNADGRKDG